MLGHRNAAIILICGKLPFAVCASAGLVVSAGFVFNEVFVYWFPNFAFASLLLVSITLLNIFGKKPALVTQVITLAVARIGLLILKLLEPDDGKIAYKEQDISKLSPAEMKPFRKEMQIIFQDPFGSLNPRMTVGQSVEEGLRTLSIYPRRLPGGWWSSAPPSPSSSGNRSMGGWDTTPSIRPWWRGLSS